MFKQDRQGVRTPADIERKHGFGKRFAEMIGLADEAKQEASNSKDAVDALDKKLTSEEIFNRLTDGGEAQGFYRDGDDVYINATLIKIINLIADHVKSTSGNQTVEIDGGSLDMKVDGKVFVSLGTSMGYPAISLRMYDNDTPMSFTFIGLGGIHTQAEPAYFGHSEVGYLVTDLASGKAAAQFSILNSKQISWKANGDGTFTLIGQ